MKMKITRLFLVVGILMFIGARPQQVVIVSYDLIAPDNSFWQAKVIIGSEPLKLYPSNGWTIMVTDVEVR